ncbi:unnamed protein product [Rhizophagus irregularis]|nr:unnamed protein product [Rhizophagus irregularis]
MADSELSRRINDVGQISKELREVVVEGTPDEYSDLYSKCWIMIQTSQQLKRLLILYLQCFNSNNNGIEFNEALEPIYASIFLSLKLLIPLIYQNHFRTDGGTLCETYGRLFAEGRRVLIGETINIY